MRQTNVRGTLSLRGFRKLRTGAIVATGVILLGLGFLAPTVSANEQDGVWIARTVAEVKADIQHIDNLSHYTIKWGDTLSAISEATGLSVDSLVEINRIADRDLIFANNKLYFSEEAFLKDGNTEVKRQRVSIDNSGSCQSYEVETKTDTVTGEQTTTVKQTTPVAVGTPAVSAPKSETSVSVAPKAETRSETSNTPSLGATTSADSGASSPVTDNAPSNTGTTNQPVASNPSSEVPAPKVEEPATPAPKAEEPASTTPKVEEPATPAPKVEEPATSAPKAEEPAATEPKTEEPMATTPKAEEPAAPAPKAEEPATPAPKVGEPATPTPKVEEPATPAPKVEEPATPTPKVEEPATPAPKAEEPATPTPKVEEPATPAPEVEEPVSPTPKAEEPAAPAPKAEEPATPAPKVGEPATPTPKVEEPATPAPKVEEPATPAPKVEEPATPAPKVEEPATPAPKAEEPATPASEVEEPVSPAPKSEEPAATTPKAEEPVSPAPKAEEPAAPAPKDDESGSSVESPSTANHSDESGAPSTTPTGDSTATQPSDSTSSPVTPSEEAPVTSGETNSTEQPSGESGKSETTSESSNTPSAEATNDSGNAATSTPTPEASTSEPKSEEELKKEEALKSAKKESIDDNIGEVVKIKADAIEKVTDADEKARLKEALKALQDKAIEEINKAKDDEEVATVTEKYQNEINALDVPGEELPAPNYNKDNLTNGRNEGTTIDNGSTAIGHGSGEAPTQPSSTSEGASSFRNAPSVQARARRVARSTSEPDGTVNISYNFAGMPDIHGFLSDPGENNTVTIPAGTSEAQAKELVKEKIQAKIKDLAARGYHVKNDIIFEQDTTVKNYNYVVTFTKETTGTSGFRMAPAVQPRASRNRRSLEQPAPQKVKVNVFYNFDQMKDIAGFLGDINGTSLEIAEGSTNEQVKAAVKSQVDAKKEELSKQGYTFKEDYVYQANGKDYNYVVTFSKAAK